MKKTLTTAEKHQLRIARDTLKMSDSGAWIAGGLNTGYVPIEITHEGHRQKYAACAIIGNLTGKDLDYRKYID